MKTALLTPALIVAITCGIALPAAARDPQNVKNLTDTIERAKKNLKHQARNHPRGGVRLDQDAWRNGTAGSSQAKPMHPRRPAFQYAQEGNRNVRQGQVRQSRTQGRSQARPQAQPRSKPKVQFRLPSNYNGAAKPLSPREANNLQKLRALKNQSRISTKGTGMPYQQGSRTKQLLQATRGQQTTASTATRTRPNSRLNPNQLQKLRDLKNQSRVATKGVGQPYQQGSRTKQLLQATRGQNTTASTATKFRPDSRANPSRVDPKWRQAGKFQKVTPGSKLTTARSATTVRPNPRAASMARSASKVRPTVKAATDIGKVAKTGKTLLKATGAGLVGGALLKDTTGIDPLELGIDAVGDVFNGTDNAKQSLDNVESSFNKSLTKQVFTDPAGAANRVGKDLEKTGKDIEKVGAAVSNFFSP